MALSSLLVFLPPVLSGILLIHVLWPERSAMAILFKLSLGAGVGLGINSLLYFICMLFGMDQESIWILQMGLFVTLLIVAVLRERVNRSILKAQALSYLQLALLIAVFVGSSLSALTFINLSNIRPQGTHDAWSIWNRAARFIYRDPENWLATASPDLYWATHPDYPLLVPLNVAWGWERVNTETQRIPQMQSAIFTFASIGLMFASVGLARTAGQASLSALILMSTPILIDSGYPQLADIPLSFFILGTCTLLYFYFKFETPPLLILAGFTAGLAAWTKNEGLLFVMISFLGLLLTDPGNIRRTLFLYMAGLAIPLTIVLYFKLAIAPGNDIFSMGEDSLATRISDTARVGLVLQALFKELWNYGGWPINIFLQLTIYAVLMRLDIQPASRGSTQAIAAMVLVQILGYCVTYLLTPHDLAWHLNFSFARLLFHVYPAGIFLYFSSVNEPEKIFRKRLEAQTSSGAKA